MKLKWPSDLSVNRFLSEYWQKKPCIIRNAFDISNDLISPEELGGMACEDGIESRLIREDTRNHKWTVEHGPFSEDVFNDLPDSHWTILVQDVDKYIPQAAGVVDQFRFLPSWRIDDLMISYAEDQGSVGPHTDSYDVFLIQLQGERLWKISDKKYSDDDLIADSEIRVLKNFEQTEEWLLKPGDMLYLPPHIAHWGISQGTCMTGSVGFISPSQEQLFNAWADFNGENLPGDCVYEDKDINATHHPGEIDDQAINRVTKILKQSIDTSPDAIRRMLGQLVSETKPSLSDTMQALEREISTDELFQKLSSSTYYPHPGLRLFYSLSDNQQDLLLFANGETFELSSDLLPFVQLLTEYAEYTPAMLEEWVSNRSAAGILTILINRGYIVEDD